MRTLKAATLALSVVSANSASAGAVVVGQNSNVGPLDATGVQRIFLGHSASNGDQPLVVIYHTKDGTRTEFESRVLGKTGSDLQIYWSALIFTGRAAPPVEVAGDDAVKAKVAENPKAIGYISDDAVDRSVRVVFKY